MKSIKTALTYVLSIHLLALLFMSLQRFVLFITNLQQIAEVENIISWVSTAFAKGVWFDNVIACYISILPLVVLFLTALWGKVYKGLFRFFNGFYSILYTLVFAIGTSNIPYFSYFLKHINSSIFNWKEEGGTAFGMMVQETSYYVYFLFFIVLVVLFTYACIWISRRLIRNSNGQKLNMKDYFIYVPASFVLIALCLFGIRGRMGYNPIKTSQAYFCTNSFLNQLGINPSFYLMRDMIESSKMHHTVENFISEQDAVAFVRKNILGLDTLDAIYPLQREVNGKQEVRPMNVVLVLMESMSADLLSVRENNKPITPFLNELIEKSYYFEKFYSAGTHTNHGITASLYGLPALFDRNMMKNVDIPLCDGLPNALQKQGYETMFFMPHEAQYDNMNAFLLENGIKEIFSEENYPKDKRVNSFGVADDFLLSYTFDKLNERAKGDKPFFATILTVSNHPPYIVPEKYVSRSNDPQYQIVAFADDAIKDFMNKVEKTAWYENTLFVFLGDHGKIVGAQPYDMPLSYNHIPLIVHAKSLDDAPQRFDKLGGQVDLYPTVMGLLGYAYKNNTLGVDLLREERPYMFFSSDDALGCIDKDYFYSYNLKTKTASLYKHKDRSVENEIDNYRSKADSMLVYSAAMFQTTNYLLKNKLTRIPEGG